jgi:hypothetical protein
MKPEQTAEQATGIALSIARRAANKAKSDPAVRRSKQAAKATS